MCSIKVLNDSSLIQEKSAKTMKETTTTTTVVTSEKDHNFKQRKRHRLDMTTTQSKTQHINYDTENNSNKTENKRRRTFQKRVNVCSTMWSVALTAVFLYILAGLPHAVAAEKIDQQSVDRRELSSSPFEDSGSVVADSENYNTNFNILHNAIAAEKIQSVDRREFLSSLLEDSENLVADSEKYNILHKRKKRSKSKNLTLLNYIEKLRRQQSPSSHRKRRKLSMGEEGAVAEGEVRTGRRLLEVSRTSQLASSTEIPTTPEMTTLEDKKQVAVSFKLSKVWNMEYADKTSDSYKTLRENVENNIINPAMTSNYGSLYLGVEDMTFRRTCNKIGKCPFCAFVKKTAEGKSVPYCTRQGSVEVFAVLNFDSSAILSESEVQDSVKNSVDEIARSTEIPSTPVEVSFKLTKQWNMDYGDKTSDSYKILREDIETNIIDPAMTSKYRNLYLGVEDMTFTQGSVEVDAVLRFDTSATVSDSEVQNSVESSAATFEAATTDMTTAKTTGAMTTDMTTAAGLFTTPYSLRITNYEYIDAYDDTTSSEYKTFVEELTEVLSDKFKTSIVGFVRLEITGLSRGSVVVAMEIYTSEETSVSEVESSIQSSFEGGCQATSGSGSTFQISENCAVSTDSTTMVSSVQTSSPSTYYATSDHTTEGFEITSKSPLVGVASTPDEEQPEDPRLSSSVPARSPTSLSSAYAATTLVHEVDVTTENPEILKTTILIKRTTDLMEYSSVKSTERSALEMQTSERTTEEISPQGTTEDYSTKAQFLMEEKTSQATGQASIEIYSTTSQNTLRLEATSDAPMEHTSIPESTEGPSTRTIEGLMKDTTSVTSEVPTSEAVATTESHSTNSVEKSMNGITSEPPMGETSQPQTMEGSSTLAMESMTLEITSHTTDVKASQAGSTETYSTKSQIKPMFDATSESPIDETSEPQTTEIPSTKAVGITRLEATSQTAEVKTSHPVSTDTYSTMADQKPIDLLEGTSLYPMDKTSDPGTTEGSSTKILEVVHLETTSQVTSEKTPESTSTELYMTKPESKPPLQATSKEFVYERIVSTEGHSTELDGRTTSESLIYGTPSLTTEDHSTKAVENPMQEPTTETATTDVSHHAATESYSIKYIDKTVTSQEADAKTTLLPVTTNGPVKEERYTSEGVSTDATTMAITAEATTAALHTTEYSLKFTSHEFIDAYNDKTSDEYKLFVREVKALLVEAFKKSIVGFVKLEIIRLRPGSVVVDMVIYTTEATSVVEVQDALETNLAGGCQATGESGDTYQTNTCTVTTDASTVETSAATSMATSGATTQMSTEEGFTSAMTSSRTTENSKLEAITEFTSEATTQEILKSTSPAATEVTSSVTTSGPEIENSKTTTETTSEPEGKETSALTTAGMARTSLESSTPDIAKPMVTSVKTTQEMVESTSEKPATTAAELSTHETTTREQKETSEGTTAVSMHTTKQGTTKNFENPEIEITTESTSEVATTKGVRKASTKGTSLPTSENSAGAESTTPEIEKLKYSTETTTANKATSESTTADMMYTSEARTTQNIKQAELQFTTDITSQETSETTTQRFVKSTSSATSPETIQDVTTQRFITTATDERRTSEGATLGMTHTTIEGTTRDNAGPIGKGTTDFTSEGTTQKMVKATSLSSSEIAAATSSATTLQENEVTTETTTETKDEAVSDSSTAVTAHTTKEGTTKDIQNPELDATTEIISEGTTQRNEEHITVVTSGATSKIPDAATAAGLQTSETSTNIIAETEAVTELQPLATSEGGSNEVKEETTMMITEEASTEMTTEALHYTSHTIRFVNLVYHTDLENPKSDLYITYSRDFVKQMSVIFEKQYSNFRWVRVDGFRRGSVIVEYTVAASGSPITTSELDTTVQSALSSSCHLSDDSSSTSFQSADCVRATTEFSTEETTMMITEKASTEMTTEALHYTSHTIRFINLVYHTDLENPKSDLYITYSRDFVRQMSVIFERQYSNFQWVRVDGFRRGSVIVEYTVAASGSPITTSELDTTVQSALSSSCHLSDDNSGTVFQSANCVHATTEFSTEAETEVTSVVTTEGTTEIPGEEAAIRETSSPSTEATLTTTQQSTLRIEEEQTTAINTSLTPTTSILQFTSEESTTLKEEAVPTTQFTTAVTTEMTSDGLYYTDYNVTAVNLVYGTDLETSTTTRYITYSRDFVNAMTPILRKEFSHFRFVRVVGFSEGSVIVNSQVASVNSAITTDELDTIVQNNLQNSCHLTEDSSSTTFQLNDGCVYATTDLSTAETAATTEETTEEATTLQMTELTSTRTTEGKEESTPVVTTQVTTEMETTSIGLYYVTYTITIHNHEYPTTDPERESFIETFENVMGPRLRRQFGSKGYMGVRVIKLEPGSVIVTFRITSSSEITDQEVEEFIEDNLLYNCQVEDTSNSVQYQLKLECEITTDATTEVTSAITSAVTIGMTTESATTKVTTETTTLQAVETTEATTESATTKVTTETTTAQAVETTPVTSELTTEVTTESTTEKLERTEITTEPTTTTNPVTSQETTEMLTTESGLYYVTYTIRILNHDYPTTPTERTSFIETFENEMDSRLRRYFGSKGYIGVRVIKLEPGSVIVTFTITSSSPITEEEIRAYIDDNLLYNCKIVSESTDFLEYQLVAKCEITTDATTEVTSAATSAITSAATTGMTTEVTTEATTQSATTKVTTETTTAQAVETTPVTSEATTQVTTAAMTEKLETTETTTEATTTEATTTTNPVTTEMTTEMIYRVDDEETIYNYNYVDEYTDSRTTTYKELEDKWLQYVETIMRERFPKIFLYCRVNKFMSGSVVVSWSTYSTDRQITEAEVQSAVDENIQQECILQDSGLQLRPYCPTSLATSEATSIATSVVTSVVTSEATTEVTTQVTTAATTETTTVTTPELTTVQTSEATTQVTTEVTTSTTTAAVTSEPTTQEIVTSESTTVVTPAKPGLTSEAATSVATSVATSGATTEATTEPTTEAATTTVTTEQTTEEPKVTTVITTESPETKELTTEASTQKATTKAATTEATTEAATTESATTKAATTEAATTEATTEAATTEPTTEAATTVVTTVTPARPKLTTEMISEATTEGATTKAPELTTVGVTTEATTKVTTTAEVVKPELTTESVETTRATSEAAATVITEGPTTAETSTVVAEETTTEAVTKTTTESTTEKPTDSTDRPTTIEQNPAEFSTSTELMTTVEDGPEPPVIGTTVEVGPDDKKPEGTTVEVGPDFGRPEGTTVETGPDTVIEPERGTTVETGPDSVQDAFEGTTVETGPNENREAAEDLVVTTVEAPADNNDDNNDRRAPTPAVTCPPNEKLSCFYCRSATSDADCQARGFWQQAPAAVTTPTCQVVRNIDSASNQIIEINQRLKDRTECVAGCRPFNTTVTQCTTCSTTAAQCQAAPVRNQVFVWLILDIPFDPDLSVTYSLKWWDMTYSLLGTLYAIHSSLPQFQGISIVRYFSGSTGVEYAVDVTEKNQDITNTVGMQALKYALTNKNQLLVNGTMVGMTGSYVFTDNPQNSYNISATSFEDLCELPEFEDPCGNGGSCSFEDGTSLLSCSCPSGYSGSTCEVKQEEVEAFLLPAVISASVLGPLAILFCILCIVLACRRRTKSKKEEERMYTETLARPHINGARNASWGRLDNSFFRPDYGRNWRQFLGQGLFGEPKQMEWDPDSASSFTVHRDKLLSNKDWNFTTYSDAPIRRSTTITEGDESDSEHIHTSSHSWQSQNMDMYTDGSSSTSSDTMRTYNSSRVRGGPMSWRFPTYFGMRMGNRGSDGTGTESHI